jgi:hypothetical protein
MSDSLPGTRRSYGDRPVVAEEYRVVARGGGKAVRPPNRRLPWRPSQDWVAKQLAASLGPLLRCPQGLIVYRPTLAEARGVEAELQVGLGTLMERPVTLSVDRWNDVLEQWQPAELAGGDGRALQVLGRLRCRDSATAERLANELRAAGEVFVGRRRRTVLVASSGEAQARAVLERGDAGDVRVVPLTRWRRRRFFSAWLDSASARKTGGWFTYDPSDD